MSYSAKSVVIDIANNWGSSTNLGLREIDFYYQGSKILLTQSSYTAYASSYFNDDVNYHPKLAFDTSLSLVDGSYGTTWLAWSYTTTNQRLIVVFNSEQIFDSIVINNYHHNGSFTDRGTKNVNIYISSNAVTNTTYDSETDSYSLIFNGQFSQHSSSNSEDPQELSLILLGGTALIDMAMDIQAFSDSVFDACLDAVAYYQDVEICLVDISTIGDITQDALLDLLLSERIFENIQTDLIAYFQSLSEPHLDIYLGAWSNKDNKLDLYCGFEDLLNINLDITTASQQLKNAFLDINIANGILTGDAGLDIYLGDGNKTQNIGLDMLTVSTKPEYKSVYAMHLNSAIREL